MKKENKSVFIAMPALGGVHPAVVDSVFKNMTSFCNKYSTNKEDVQNKIEIRTVTGSLVYDARKLLVRTFLEESDKSHFFFWDSDIILFEDTINKLMEFDKDVISIVYYSKNPPYHPVMGIERIEVSDDIIGTRKIVDNKYLQNETQEVWGVGLGGCLIKREVLETMMDKYENPFFPIKQLGEDYAFCERLREQNYKVNIAPQIRTFHQGQTEIQVDDYMKVLKGYISQQINERAQKMREEQVENGESEGNDKPIQ